MTVDMTTPLIGGAGGDFRGLTKGADFRLAGPARASPCSPTITSLTEGADFRLAGTEERGAGERRGR